MNGCSCLRMPCTGCTPVIAAMSSDVNAGDPPERRLPLGLVEEKNGNFTDCTPAGRWQFVRLSKYAFPHVNDVLCLYRFIEIRFQLFYLANGILALDAHPSLRSAGGESASRCQRLH